MFHDWSLPKQHLPATVHNTGIQAQPNTEYRMISDVNLGCRLIGASRPPTGSPMGLPTYFLFFFFLPPHLWWPFVVKKTTDWAEILHNHTYGHASGRGKNIFGALIFHWVMWVKLLKKTFVTHNTEMKSLIGLIFCRNMLMDSLQGQLKKKPRGLALCLTRWKTMTT